jgi:prepilin peptidase CpaA
VTLAGGLSLIFPALVVVAALRDLVSYTIPNWISIALVAGFFVVALVVGVAPIEIGRHVLVGLAALAGGIGLYALRWIGGGDAKLLGAATLWLGWSAAGPFLIATVLAGGVLTGLLLGLRSGFLGAWASHGPAWLARLAKPGEPVPYGVAIAVGALAALPQSPFAMSLGLAP